MGVLTEKPPSGGLLADLLARLMAGRQMPPQPALGGRVAAQPANVLPSWKAFNDQVGDLPRARVDPLPEMAPDVHPTNMQPSWKEWSDRVGPLPQARVDVPPGFTSGAQAALRQYVDQPPPMGAPPMPPAPAPGAPPVPVVAQQGPMGGLMSAPNAPQSFPIPMQKPQQPAIEHARVPSSGPILSPGLGGHAKPVRKQMVAKGALTDSDYLNLAQLFPNMNRQQIAALWARRQATG